MNTTVLAYVELPDYIARDISTLLSWIAGVAAVVCTAKIIFVGARMAWDHKHNPGLESPTAAEFLGAVIGWIIASAASAAVAAVLINAGQAPGGATEPTPPTIVSDIEGKYPHLEESK